MPRLRQNDRVSQTGGPARIHRIPIDEREQARAHTDVAQKWTSECRWPERPGLMKRSAALIVRMATENPDWGYSRIQGALKNLDHRVARSTVAKVLKDNGIPPAPGRPHGRAPFCTHWGAIETGKGLPRSGRPCDRGYTIAGETRRHAVVGGGCMGLQSTA